MVITKKNKKVLIIAALLAILALATWLRFYNIENHVLWYDEILSVTLAESKLSLIFQTAPFTFLHYLLIKLGLLLGNTIWAIKLPGLLAAIGSIITIFFIGKELKNHGVGLIAALLLALQPVHIFYSTEVRYYVFMVFFSALFALFFIKASKSAKLFWFIPLTLSCLALLFTHFVAAFIPLALIIYLLVAILLKKRKIHNISISPGILWSAIIFLVGAFSLLGLRLVNFGSIGIFNQIIWDLDNRILFQSRFLGIHSGRHGDIFEFIINLFSNFSPPVKFLGIAIFLTLFFIGLIFLFRKNKLFALYIVILLGLMMFAPYFITLDQRRVWSMRYLITFLPFWIVTISFGIYEFGAWLSGKLIKEQKVRKVAVVLILSIVVIVAVISVIGFSKKVNSYHTLSNNNHAEIATYLTKITTPGDIIIIRKGEFETIYYFNGGPGIEYKPGTRTIAVAGKATFIPRNNYLQRILSAHSLNNNDVIILTDELIAEDVEAVREQFEEAVRNNRKIIFVTTPSFADSTISQILEEKEKIASVSGSSFISVTPKESIEELYIPITASKLKNKFGFSRTAAQVAERYYIDSLSIADGVIALEDGKVYGSILYPLRFNRERAESIGRNYYIPESLIVEIVATIPDHASVAVATSLNNRDFSNETKLTAGDFFNDSLAKIEIELREDLFLAADIPTLYLKIMISGDDSPQLSEIRVSVPTN